MKLATVAVFVALALAACSSATGGRAPSPSPSPSPTASPQTTGLANKLCSRPVSAASALVIFGVASFPTTLAILDTSDPPKPVVACKLGPAQGGRFLSATKVAFWSDDRLATADLSSGEVVQTGRLPLIPYSVAFNRDGSKVAYRVQTAAGGMAVHLYIAGVDRVLYTEEPIGGHGGPPYGPVEQLDFSPDGSQLLDYSIFRPTGSLPNFIVWNLDGSIRLQSTSDAFGVWSSNGTKLYFMVWGAPAALRELHSIDSAGSETVEASGLTGFYFPELAPDGGSIVYDTYDTSAPGQATGGLPHIWRFDINLRRTSQISAAISTQPEYVGPTMLWSDEGRPCDCGPGGASAPDGVILAHDVRTGRDSKVDVSFYLQLLGLPADRVQVPFASTYNVEDAWFAAGG